MTTSFEIGSAGPQMSNGSVAQIEAVQVDFATIAPAAGSNPTAALAATAAGPLFVTVTADENVNVAFGTAPNATSGNRRAMAAGATRSFPFQPGWKCDSVTR